MKVVCYVVDTVEFCVAGGDIWSLPKCLVFVSYEQLHVACILYCYVLYISIIVHACGEELSSAKLNILSSTEINRSTFKTNVNHSLSLNTNRLHAVVRLIFI